MRAGLAGDAGAYKRLLAALTPVLRATIRRGFSRSQIGSVDVEDVLQETLLALHLKRHTWDPAQPLGPWLMAITRHKLIDSLRRRGRRGEVPVDDFLGILENRTAESAPDDVLDKRDAERLLGTLQPRSRDIVQSIAIEGRSAREVGDRLSMTEGAVRVALHRGLKQLAATYRRLSE